MAECSKCGKPVSGELCPYCKTPLPAVSLAKQADADFDIYESFNAEEVTIFNHYLRLVQSGWLEVAAVDGLSTDYNKDLETIKAIIKRGLKALQKAQERAQKEAELKARQLAKNEKKNIRLAARRAHKEERQKQRSKAGGGGAASANRASVGPSLRLVWLWLIALTALITIAIFIFWPRDELLPPPAEPLPPPAETIEIYFLRQGRVACYQQHDMEQITISANNRQQFEEILASGRCFINHNYVQVKDISQVNSSLRKGYVQDLGWVFFHNEGLEKQIISQP